MLRSTWTLAALAAAAPAPAAPAAPATDLPALEAIKWYNSPPLSFDDLQGKAVMIEVFRTW